MLLGSRQVVDSTGGPFSLGCCHTLQHPSQVFQPTFRRLGNLHRLQPLHPCGWKRETVALLKRGASRAHFWISKTSKPSSDFLRNLGTTVSGHTEHRFRRSHLILTNKASVYLPASYQPSCENWLPTRVEGPSSVDPPVRLRRRTLACPVLPLWTYPSTSGCLATPCDISLIHPPIAEQINL